MKVMSNHMSLGDLGEKKSSYNVENQTKDATPKKLEFSSDGEGEGPSAGQPAEEGLPMEEALATFFLLAGLLGLYILRRRDNGSYIVQQRSVVVLTLACLVCLAGLTVLCLTFLMVVPFWFKVMLLPYAFGYLFCLMVYIETARHARDMKQQMALLSSHRIRVDFITRNIHIIGLIYALVLTSCDAVMFLRPQDVWVVPLMALVNLVPSVLDLHTFSYVNVIQTCVRRLTEKVKEQSKWTCEQVQLVTKEWLQLDHTLDNHNQMFSLRVHLRLVGLMVQVMSYSFVLWSLQDSDGRCAAVQLVLLLPLLHVTTRLHWLCWVGQQFIASGETLLRRLREAAYGVDLTSPQHSGLSALTARLEAAPPALHNWGMDHLSARTFVMMSGVVLTYVVVLMQFCRSSHVALQYDHFSNVFTSYDHCFVPPNTTSSSP